MATQRDAAAHLDLAASRMRALMIEGVLPRQRRGQYDLDELRVAYIRHLRKRASGRPGHAASAAVEGTPAHDLLALKVRVERVRAGKLESDAAQAAGELVEVSRVRDAWTGVLAEIRTALLAVPSKIAGALVGLESEREAVALLDGEIRDGLRSAARAIEIGSRDTSTG